MVRENWSGILLYSFVFTVTWRLHEYGHITAANLTGARIVMNINTWIIPVMNAYVTMAGPLTSLLLTLIGTFLVFKYTGVVKVIGFYMTFSPFLHTLGSLLTGTVMNRMLDIYNEYTWKMMVVLPMAILLILQIRYANLNLKPSCVFWLVIISLVIVTIIITIDSTFWMLYQQRHPITNPILGQMTIVYLFDATLITFGKYLQNKLKQN